MLKDIKLGWKIGGGYVIILGLLLLVGTLTIVNLSRVKTITGVLSNENLPSVNLSNQIERMVSNTYILTQAYLVSGDKKTLAAIRKDLEETKKLLGEAEAVAKKSSGLKQLEDSVGKMNAMLKNYERGLNQIVELTNGLNTERGKATDAGRVYLDAAAAFLKVQLGEMSGEIAVGVKAEKLQDRLNKIQYVKDLNDLAFKLDKVGMRAQVTRNPRVITDANVLFVQVNKIVGELKKITNVRHKALRKMLDDIQKASDNTKAAYASFAQKWQQKDAEAKKLDDLSNQILALVKENSEVSIKDISAASKRSVNSLSGTSVVMIIGFVISVFLGLLISFVLVTSINKPVKALIDTSVPISNGDLTQRVTIKSKDELGMMANAFNDIVKTMNNIITQVRMSANKVASSAQEMSSSSEEMNATTQEVSTAITKVSKGAETQAQRIDETFETMEKASASIKQMVDNAQTANKTVTDASDTAMQGKKAADVAVAKIEQLTSAVTDTAQVIQKLGQMSQQIGEITETITSIADQTNLLALNAAIEAARAGEAGRGFAVVAEEVRKLAEGSAEAVRKIGGLIRSIQTETTHAVNAIDVSSKEVQEGKTQVTNISAVLNGITEAAKSASGVTSEIVAFGHQIIIEVEQVVKSLNEVVKIARESASTAQEVTSSTEEQTASMQEMSASAQELARLSADLMSIVSKFKLDSTEAAAASNQRGGERSEKA
ncbi:MAG TPA: methyl-accepting chemotaxis protein [Candidatus Omnitrophota bacterium]|nr:methyl-accepting chemotaxis protein [Candidatus Omnitrophota bacterium]HNQ50529.1 methyl-accepting chemotaxis protein [Candidatus Omnitrophota bacterium]HQO37474.1 methyl-accepting chemotaxis protein [Candidatus Omnitrophota bacterium]HQQ06499.1 methyl-accepting chemotaxis protein [Candidatus Omnitrophota bacterium]